MRGRLRGNVNSSSSSRPRRYRGPLAAILVVCFRPSILSFWFFWDRYHTHSTQLQSLQALQPTATTSSRAARQRDASNTRHETHLKIHYQQRILLLALDLSNPPTSNPFTLHHCHAHCFPDRCMSYTADVSIAYFLIINCSSYVLWHKYTCARVR